MSSIFEKARRVVFWVIFLMLLLVIIGLTKSLFGFLHVGDRFLRVENEIVVLEEEKQRIENKLNLEDPQFVAEKQLRDSLGLSQAGEAVVVLPEKLIEETTADRKKAEAVEQEVKNWQKWAKLFF